MNEYSSLKIAIITSIGIHLLFLGIASGLFGIPSHASASYVRVRLLPFEGSGTPGPPGNASGPQKTEIKKKNSETSLNHTTPPRKGLQMLQPSSESILEKTRIVSKRPEAEKISSKTKLNNGNETVSLKTVAFTEEKTLASQASMQSGETGGNGVSGNGGEEGAGAGFGNGGSGNGGSEKKTGLGGNLLDGDGWGNGILPKYAKEPKFRYPPDARRKGYEGEGLLKVEILSNGDVGEITIRRSSGYSVLDRQAIVDMKPAKFIPPFPKWVMVPFEFRLQ